MNAALEIRRFTRRVRRARFAGAFADGVAVTALAAAAALLCGRLLGVWPAPAAWWAGLLAPPLLWAAWRVRGLGFGDARSAVHLDRRLGLEGLLITGLEQDTAAWQHALAPRLQRARAALPRLRGRRLLARSLLPLALLGGILLLPPPAVRSHPPADPVLEQAMADLEEQIDLLAEQAVLSEEKSEELRARLQELEEHRAHGEPVAWSDVDGLRDELLHEREHLAASLQKTRSALAAAQAQAAQGGEAAAAEQISDAIEQAARAGLLDALDPELAGQLGLQPGAQLGAFDPSALPTSADELQALAAALREAMDGRLAQLGESGLLDPDELLDLAALAEEAALLPPEPLHEHGPG